jgi:ribose 5-phosphate isomerase B
MKIVIASDHGAVDLKQNVLDYLSKKGHQVTNLGVNNTDSVDYPDMAQKACTEYKKGGYDFGILLCGTGIGISISANKVAGIRCALIQDNFAAQMAKAHNNANFIAFGGRMKYPVPVTEMIETFIKTPFEGGRHQTRVNKMHALENADSLDNASSCGCGAGSCC